MKQMNERVEQWAKKAGKYKYAFLVLLVGLVLLLLPTGSRRETAAETPAAVAPVTETGEGFSVEREEQRLAEVLSSIRGAGDCRVLLAVSATEETELARDGEETVILSGSSGKESAVTVRSVYPAYEGAVVVCTGAGGPAVKYDVLSAVMAYTGLDSSEITVCAMRE